MDEKSDRYPGGYKTNSLQIAVFTVFLSRVFTCKKEVIFDENDFFSPALGSFFADFRVCIRSKNRGGISSLSNFQILT